MGLFTKDIETMDDLFVRTLQNIYYAEHQIADALPGMIEKATAPQLRGMLERHLGETHARIRRAEQVCAMHGMEAKQLGCSGIDGILRSSHRVVSEVEDTDVRDAAIVAGCQMIEHFEIARYGSVITWVRQLGRNDCALLLEQSLAEERGADARLTRLAQGRITTRDRPLAA